ncbi:MAG: thioesterase domain-containing protein, partial [Actinomycetota bacterium]|nr:thioesterase domain-containing protein [Actinomycetota bacterium]
YVIGSAGQAVDTRDVIRSLRTSLPAHMVPTDVVQLDRLPLTPNGKLDRRALPAPAEQGASTDDAPPHDSLEWILLDIWQKVLGRKHISIHDDFFALGGYSLLATRLFAILEERTGHRLPVSVLFEHPTIAALATAIRDDGWRTEWSSLVPIQPAGAAQPFFYVAPYMISVLELAPLGDELGSDRPLYGLQPQGLDGALPAHPTIEEMAAHYIAEMKSVQPEGPYAIGGHCAGSWVAFEMARQLEAAGDEISALALVDQGPPGVEKPEIKKLPYIAHRIRFYFSGGRLRQAMAWKFKIITGRLLLRRVGSPTARFEEQVKEVHRAAYRVYQGGRIAHDITLVLSADSLSLDDKAWYRRWSEVTDGGLTTKNVGGTHANLLVQPFVHDLAREIAAVLDQPVVDDADQPAADAPPSAS